MARPRGRGKNNRNPVPTQNHHARSNTARQDGEPQPDMIERGRITIRNGRSFRYVIRRNG